MKEVLFYVLGIEDFKLLLLSIQNEADGELNS
jgi:hypothetical protein